MQYGLAVRWTRFRRLETAFRAGAVCLIGVLAGCGQSAEMKKMGFQGPAPVVPNTEVIAKFMGPEGITSLYKSFDELSASTVPTRAAATNAKFVELYEAFRNEAIPEAFKSDQREQDKAALVKAIDGLLDGVKKNASDAEIRNLAQPVRPAAEAFMRPTNY